MSTNQQFTVDLSSASSGYIDIQMKILALGEVPEIEVALPVWTPGSYLVREYAQFLTQMHAKDDSGGKRKVTKVTKSVWVIDCHQTTEINISYRLYGQTLNVRYNHFDSSHAFVHGPATFLYLKQSAEASPISVEIVNTNWEITTGLKKIGPHTFLADDYDMLIDCPLEIGDNEAIAFEVLGTPHRFEFWGEGNFDAEQIAVDTQKIITSAADIFDAKLPYDSFSFITHLTEKDYGGLEHRNSTALMVPRDSFREGPMHKDASKEDTKYRQFLGLVSHEFFHTWNVKRIKPAAFNHFDYQNENYTRDMWTVEGITSYYDDLILRRAGLISRDTYLEGVAKMITRLESIPGRLISSLEDASFDTWIRLYRPHAVNHNSNVSYYLKGSLVSLLLDLKIRSSSRDSARGKSLDDVMHFLWTHHSGDTGYGEGSYESIVEKVCDIDCKSFFDRFIRGCSDPDWNTHFAPFGLTLNWESDPQPYLGAALSENRVKTVDDGSPALGKLHPGDEILAVDGKRFSSDMDALLKTYNVGQSLTMTGFRNGTLFSVEIELGEGRAGKYGFEILDNLKEETRQLRNAWI